MIDEFLNAMNAFLLQKRKILFILVISADIIGIFYMLVFFDFFDDQNILYFSQKEIIDFYDKYISFFIIISLNILFFISNKKETFSLLSHNDLMKHYKKEETITLSNNMIKIESNSVLIFKEYLPIENINFIQNNNTYELPWFIQGNGINKLLQEFQLDNKKSLRNKLTLSLVNIDFSKNKLNMYFQKATYFDSLLTNSSADSKIIYNLTVRDLLEPGPSLNPLREALPANHLGVSCLVITNDNYILLPKRGSNVNDFKNNLSPSVSGALNLDLAYKDGHISIINALKGEFIEEINFQNHFKNPKENNLDTKEQYKLQKERMSKYINENCILIGLTRELLRLGKPEAFFILNTNISKEILMKDLNTYKDNGEERNESKENEKYLFISLKNLKDNIHEITKGKYKFVINNENYKISESLLVNILLYIKWASNKSLLENK